MTYINKFEIFLSTESGNENIKIKVLEPSMLLLVAETDSVYIVKVTLSDISDISHSFYFMTLNYR